MSGRSEQSPRGQPPAEATPPATPPATPGTAPAETGQGLPPTPSAGDLSVRRARAARIEGLFHDAADLPPVARRDFVRSATNGDPDLERDVMDLLSNLEDGTRGVLAVPVGSLLADPIGPVPEQVGHFRIIRAAGEGGMSRVFEAQQESPRRRVALKLLRSGMVSREAMARFSREVQALAAMNHPCIAHVYESGTFDVAGLGPQPYFAMEFIDGLAIDAYAARHNLPLAARLQLVAQVADAIQHAHERGVIHRDLKPANIMVDTSGRPKVLDFGVARAANLSGESLYTLTLRTDAGQLIGTVPYMSPEQVSGRADRVDGRSDVYALGVILYEMLAGVLPLDLRGRSLPDAIQRILNEEPTRLGSVDTRLRGDIETIVSKALEKEPARRYASAKALADDLRRFLADEPVVARRASTMYQFSKFARRNRGLVTGIGIAVGALLVGSVFSVFWAISAHRAAGVALSKEKLATEEAYRSALAAASSALRVGDAGEARRQLARAPEPPRGWEWFHYRSRLDDSIFAIETRVAAASFSRDGTQLNVLSDHGAEGLVSPARWRSFSTKSFAQLAQFEIQPTRRITEMNSIIVGVGPNDTWTMDLTDIEPRLVKDSSNWAPAHLGPLVSQGAKRRLRLARGGVLLLLMTGDSPNEFTSLLSDTVESSGTLLVDADSGRVVAPADRRVMIAEIPESAGAPLFRWLDGHTSIVRSLGWKPGESGRAGPVVFSVADDGTLRAWDFISGTPTLFKVAELDDSRPKSLAVSPDGTRVAVGGESGSISIYDSKSGRRVSRLVGPTSAVVLLRYAPNGAMLASIEAGGSLRVFNTAVDDPWTLKGHESYVYGTAISAERNELFTCAWDGTIRVWDTRSLRLRRTIDLRAAPGQDTQVRALALSPDGRSLAALVSRPRGAGPDSMFEVMMMDLNDPVSAPRRAFEVPSSSAIHFVGNDAVAHLSTNAPVLASATDGRIIARAPLAVSGGSPGGPDLLAFHAPSETLALRIDDTRVALLDARTMAARATLNVAAGDILALRFSPNGDLLAVGTAAGDIHMLDVRTGATLWSARVHNGAIYTLAWLADGSRLISAGNDRAVRLIHPRTGVESAQLRGHESYIMHISVDDRGRIFTASGDTTVRVWSIQSAAERNRDAVEIPESRGE